MHPLPELLDRYELTPEEFQKLVKIPAFRRAYAEAKRNWRSLDAIENRIKHKSQLLTEDNLLELYRIARDVDVHPSVRIEAMKQLAKLAKVDAGEQKDTPTAPGSQFVVNISIGDEPMRTITSTAVEVSDENELESTEVRVRPDDPHARDPGRVWDARKESLGSGDGADRQLVPASGPGSEREQRAARGAPEWENVLSVPDHW